MHRAARLRKAARQHSRLQNDDLTVIHDRSEERGRAASLLGLFLSRLERVIPRSRRTFFGWQGVAGPRNRGSSRYGTGQSFARILSKYDPVTERQDPSMAAVASLGSVGKKTRLAGKTSRAQGG